MGEEVRGEIPTVRSLDRGIESGASPNPRDGTEELTGYLARRDKRDAAGTLVPGPTSRRETAVCHKWHVRW